MSAQLKAAKDVLDQAVTAYKCSKSVIKKTLESTEVSNERTLNNKIKSLNDTLSTLNAAHTSWVSKAEFTDDQLQSERYSLEWLENEWIEVGEIQDKMCEKLSVSAPPVQSNSQKLFICVKQMESLQLDIKKKLDNLHSKTDPSSSISSIQAYTDLVSNVKDCLTKDFNILAQTIMSLDAANDVTEKCTQFEEFRQVQQSKIVDIELRLAEKVSSPSTSSTINRMKGIEMEKSKAPSFSGKTIDYPEFKKGWQKVPGIMWEDSNQVEQIKFKVDTNTRRIISRCNNMTEVWKVLDAEFAQEQEVINAVDEELRTLKSTECSTPQYIVNLRNYLPTLEEALRGVNGLEHLCSPDRVHFLAAKFDERTMYDWEYFRSKNSGTTYARFFNFLLDRYDASRTTIARLKSASSIITNNTIPQTVNLTSSGVNDNRMSDLGLGSLVMQFILVQVADEVRQLVKRFFIVWSTAGRT